MRMEHINKRGRKMANEEETETKRTSKEPVAIKPDPVLKNLLWKSKKGGPINGSTENNINSKS